MNILYNSGLVLQIFFIFVPVLVGILLGLNLLLSTRNPDTEKLSIYECGFNAQHGQTRSQFNINFYIIAMFFLIFDLEVLLLYPVAVSFYEIGFYGFSIVVIFFLVLTIGFILEIGSGAIKIKSNKNN
jgi:NADH:ubiquinone oxidoreductase subunit 3 (subunit A)